MAFARNAAADAVPSCNVTAPSQVLIGEPYLIELSLDNLGDQAGFVPSIDLRLPNGVSVVSAVGLEQSASVLAAVPFVGGARQHPLTKQLVSRTGG